MTAVYFWDPAVMLCVQFLDSEVRARRGWDPNPMWILCYCTLLSPFPQYFGPFVFRLHCWDLLLPGCTPSVEAYEGHYVLCFSVVLIPHLSIPFSWRFLQLLWGRNRPFLCFPLELYAAIWLSLICLVLTQSSILCCLIFTVTYVHFFSLILVGCAVWCMVQYLRMVNRLMYNLILLPQGTQLNIYMLNLHTAFSELGTAFSLLWVILPLLLSLWLVRMYAQNTESLAPGSCWYLVLFQPAGDEVRGICPLAYDVRPTEASWVDRLSLVHQSARQSTPFFWLICRFQLHWDEVQGRRAPHLFHVLKVLLRPDHRRRATRVHYSLFGIQVFVINFLLGLPWLMMLSYVPMQCVSAVKDYFCDECSKQLQFNCSICTVWFGPHISYVFGLCLLALGWHHMLPGDSLKGLGFKCLQHILIIIVLHCSAASYAHCSSI